MEKKKTCWGMSLSPGDDKVIQRVYVHTVGKVKLGREKASRWIQRQEMLNYSITRPIQKKVHIFLKNLIPSIRCCFAPGFPNLRHRGCVAFRVRPGNVLSSLASSCFTAGGACIASINLASVVLRDVTV